MASRLAAMIVWAAAAASAVFWGYRLFVKALPVPPQAALVETGVPPVGGDLTRLFGAPAAEALAAEEAVPPADARFKLVGVVAPGRGQRGGLALISVDGKAPRAVGIGGMVEGDLALVSVSHRRVELRMRSGGTSMALELPALPEATRGTLGEGAAVTVPPMPAPPPVVNPAVPPVPGRIGGRQGVPGGFPPGPVVPSPAVPNPAPGTNAPPAPFGVTPPAPAVHSNTPSPT
jgi:general secretion pathway protein C